MHPRIIKNQLNIKPNSKGIVPVFILGMPRSGTTLVEQILASHSKITGAGELNFIGQAAEEIVLGTVKHTMDNITTLRLKYLSDLEQRANGKRIVTDKMPHNFRFISLICAALPEAKIIHVQRDAKATCWSNFRQYFHTNGLGYCYDLSDVINYYHLYLDLMNFWQKSYKTKIYNLNYEKSQKIKIMRPGNSFITWVSNGKTRLTPNKNDRSVNTASQMQVRQKVY